MQVPCVSPTLLFNRSRVYQTFVVWVVTCRTQEVFCLSCVLWPRSHPSLFPSLFASLATHHPGKSIAKLDLTHFQKRKETRNFEGVIYFLVLGKLNTDVRAV